jgi:tetratricopeptide (TPR) repeat protein
MKNLLLSGLLLVTALSARDQAPQYRQALEDSLQHYTSLVAGSPENDTLLMKRGDIYFRLERYDRAIADFTRAIKVDLRNDAAYYYRAICHKQQGNISEAVSDLKMALAIFPDDGSYDTELGNLYLGQGQYKKALEHLHRAVPKDPDSGVPHLLRGTCYYLLKLYDKAIPDLTRAIRLRHGLEKAHLLRGNCYKELERTGKAVVDYSKVIKLNPRNFRAYYYRGLILVAKGKKQAGVKDLNTFLKFQGKINPSAEEVRKLIREHGSEPQY